MNLNKFKKENYILFLGNIYILLLNICIINWLNMEREIQPQNEEVTLKIQTLESQYQVTIKRSSSVNELKEKLSEVLQ